MDTLVMDLFSGRARTRLKKSCLEPECCHAERLQGPLEAPKAGRTEQTTEKLVGGMRLNALADAGKRNAGALRADVGVGQRILDEALRPEQVSD